jgi:tight adherence protein B
MLGLLVSGVVAATVLAVYGSAAAHLALRAAARRDDARSRAAAIDAVAALAAELRAGLAVSVALADVDRCLTGPAVVGADSAVVARRVASAIEVAETSGAPLAEVLDRLDAHLRATDRARAAASAQAAGARASAALLAAMPVAGAGLGFLVGTDPLAILLNTPLGAACLGAAVMLQLGGLAWAARISRVQVAL